MRSSPGGIVTSWPDSGPSGLYDGTAVESPTYIASSVGGQPAVGTATDALFTLASELTLPDTGWTVYAVVSIAEVNGFLAFLGKDDPSNLIGTGRSVSNTFVRSDGVTSQLLEPTARPTGEVLIRYRWDGTGPPRVAWTGQVEREMTAGASEPWAFTQLLGWNNPSVAGHEVCEIASFGSDTVADETDEAIRAYFEAAYEVGL